MIEYREIYWAHRDAFRVAFAVGAVLVVQSAFILWAFRRLSELGHVRERLSRLGDGLALLTDTTEAGMETLARELQQTQRRQAAPRATPRTVGKRVAAAARKGEELSAIAGDEQLSESEVRLHLKMADSRSRDAGIRAL